MKFKDIKFDDPGRFANSGSGIRLPGGYWVSKKVFHVAYSKIEARFSELDWRKLQTAESIIGETFWKTCEIGYRLALGRCVRYFADHDVLRIEIEVANEGKKGKRKYRPK